MNNTDPDFKASQRAYDNLLPEPEGKFTCKQCGERLWESDMAQVGLNVCCWCDDENGFKELVKVMNQQSMKELK